MSVRLDVAIRWTGTQWYAYNIGVKPPYAATEHWSTGLGDIDVEDIIIDLFRNSNITFLPCE